MDVRRSGFVARIGPAVSVRDGGYVLRDPAGGGGGGTCDGRATSRGAGASAAADFGCGAPAGFQLFGGARDHHKPRYPEWGWGFVPVDAQWGEGGN